MKKHGHLIDVRTYRKAVMPQPFGRSGRATNKGRSKTKGEHRGKVRDLDGAGLGAAAWQFDDPSVSSNQSTETVRQAAPHPDQWATRLRSQYNRIYRRVVLGLIRNLQIRWHKLVLCCCVRHTHPWMIKPPH